MNRRYVFTILSIVKIVTVTVTDGVTRRTARTGDLGTTLYGLRDLKRNWTKTEAVRLQTRMIVEGLIPRKIPGGGAFVKYLNLVVDKSEIIDNNDSRKTIMVLVADVLGGYLNSVLLPKVKSSYYEGRESYEDTNKLHGTLRKIKFILNTDGRGWIPRTEAEELFATTDVRAADGRSSDVVWTRDRIPADPCAALRLNSYSHVPVPMARDDEGDDVDDDRRPGRVPLPTFDDDRSPGSLAVPFTAGKRLYAVDKPGTEADGHHQPVLVRYYRLAAACASRIDPDRFRRDVRRWLDRAVEPLLAAGHRRWYPVLAGASAVVRAAEWAEVYGAPGSAAGQRRKRGTSGRRDGDWLSCDDGPVDRLPDLNTFLLVILISLTTTWLGLTLSLPSPEKLN